MDAQGVSWNSKRGIVAAWLKELPPAHPRSWVLLTRLVPAVLVSLMFGPALNLALASPVEDRAGVPASAPLLGANADLAALPSHARKSALDELVIAGVNAVRMPARWAMIERSQGTFDWSELDSAMEAAARRDFLVLLTLKSAPSWSRRDPTPPDHVMLCEPSSFTSGTRDGAPPTEVSSAARFASELARRYPELWAIEIWSEPNLFPNWRELGPDPEDYAVLLSEVADAVHTVRAEILVVSAGLAPTTDLSACALSDVVFLDRLARTGALSKVDAVAIEPLGLRDGPDDPRADREVLNFARAHVLADVLQDHGVHAPLWAVAWGWRAETGGAADADSPWGGFPSGTAADHLGRGWSIARSEMPWLGPMFVWHLHPPGRPSDSSAGFALVDDQGEPTALMEAVRAIGLGDLAQPESTDPLESPARIFSKRTVGGLLLIAGVVSSIAAMLVRPVVGPSIQHMASLGRRMAQRKETRLVWAGSLCANALVAYLIPSDGPVSANLMSAAYVTLLVLVAYGIILATIRPADILASIFVMAPLYSAVRFTVGARAVGPVELLIALAVAGVLIRWFGRLDAEEDEAEVGFRKDGRLLDIMVLGLIVWSAVSVPLAEYPLPALYEWRTVILEPVLVFWLLRLGGRCGRRAALDGLVFGAVIAAAYGLVDISSFGEGGVFAEGVLRATGPFASPNNLSLWLGRAIAASTAFVIASGFGGAASPWRRRLYRIALVPLVFALLATFSRGAILFGMTATLAYLAILASGGRVRRRPAAIAAVVAAACVIAFLPFAGTPRVREAVSMAPGSTGYIRVHLWLAAAEMGRDHPVLGVGLDNFLPHYRDRYVHREVIQERFLSHPHNALLDWWTRLGIPGVLLFIGIAWQGIRRWPAIVGSKRVIGSSPSGRDPALAAAGLGLLVYALAHGAVDNHFFLVDLALAWWLGLALVTDVDAPEAQGLPEVT